MSVSVRRNQALKEIVDRQMDAGPVREIATQYVRVGGVTEHVGTFVEPFSITRMQPVGASNLSGGATTDSIRPILSGGLSPYSYQYTLLSDPDGLDPVINSPTSASTTFTRTSGSQGDATFRVTVTDDLGATDTADFTATWQTLSGGGA